MARSNPINAGYVATNGATPATRVAKFDLARKLRFLVSLLLLHLVPGCDSHEQLTGKRSYAGTSTWSPVVCPWVWPTELPAGFTRERILGTGYASHYAGDTNRIWPVVFSQNVTVFQLHFPWMSIGGGDNDFLKLYYNGGTVTFDQYSSAGSDFYTGFYWPKPGNYVEMEWHTGDSSEALNGNGWEIYDLKVSCTMYPGPLAPPLYTMRNTPYDLFLLGEGDVIYLKTVQPANHRMFVSTWPMEASSGADFDIYVGWHGQTYPTHSNADQVSQNGLDPNNRMFPEGVLIPATTANRDVYIAVGSFTGKGHVRLYANALPNTWESSMNVWTDFVPAESDKTRIKKYLRKLTLAMHFATDGRSLVTDYHLYWYPNTAPVGLPKWGFSYKEGGGACGDYHDGLGTRIIVRSNYWCKCAQGLPPGCTCTSDDTHAEANMVTPMHEFGHCYLNLPDEEYCPVSAGWCGDNPKICGHSVMGGSGWPSHFGGIDFCDGVNGGENIDSFCCYPQPGHSSSIDNWPRLMAAHPGVPTKDPNRTPDPFAATGQMDFNEKPVDGIISFHEP